MTVDESTRLLAYGAWANALMLEAAAKLPEEQLHATVCSSFPSVGATLAHIIAAEWTWLCRWLGESPAPPGPTTQPSLGELEAQLAALQSRRSLYLSGLSNGDLAGVVNYRTWSGNACSDSLSDLILHVVNHSSYHRGQLATLFRQLGHVPPSTDLIRYLWHVKGPNP